MIRAFGTGDIVDMSTPGEESVKHCPSRYYFDAGSCYSVDEPGAQSIAPDLYQCNARGIAQQAAATSQLSSWAPYAMAGGALLIGILIGRSMS